MLKSWAASSTLFLTLIYSTGLHLAWGPESTVRATYFNGTPRSRAAGRFPDQGSLHERPLHVLGDDAWKLAGFTKDQIEYLIQSNNLADGRAPYKYRFLPTLIVGALARGSGMPLPRAFLILNVMSIWVAALVFTAYLRRYYRFGNLLAHLGGVLLVTMVAVTRTVSYPMLEPASILATTLLFWTVAGRRVFAFMLLAVCAIATKEVLAVSGLLWLAHHAQRHDRRRLFMDVLIAVWPIVGFVAIRMLLGGDSLTHDGHDLLAGDVPFAHRLWSARENASFLLRTFLAFGLMWLGLQEVRRYPMLARHSLMIPPVVFATYFLSMQVTRVLGVLYAVVIPGFLLLFSRWLQPDEPEREAPA